MQEIKEKLSAMCQAVIDEKVNPLHVYTKVKDLDKFIKEVLSEIEGAVINEADKYPEKTFEFEGHRFEKRNGGVSYDFKHLDEWNVAKNNLKAIEDKYKGAYLNCNGGLISVDSDTGEELELPHIKPRKDSLVIKGVIR
jgi:hypothetical protein